MVSQQLSDDHLCSLSYATCMSVIQICAIISLSLRDGIGSRAGGVDISDLTWEQKEQCLRLLFAKMNRHKTATSSAKKSGHTTTPALPAPPIHGQNNAESASSPSVFITERSTGSRTNERGVASPGVRESQILQQTVLEQIT